MSLTDQERIEMSADNCEVLRGRLAKYEDAEGNPISTIAEQAREIERLTSQLEHWLSLDKQRDAEPAALKAQPSGVVPGVVDERAAFEAAVCERYGYTGGSIISRRVGDYYADASLSQAWALWKARAALTASAPNHSELEVLREYRTAIRNFNDCHGVETDTLEEGVEIERKAEARLEAAEKACHDFYAGREPALNHSEQVRELPPFAQKVISKLKRFEECASDSDAGGVDIGRHWLDLLTQLGLLNRVQRSPGLWEISQQGEDVLAAAPSSGSQGGDA